MQNHVLEFSVWLNYNNCGLSGSKCSAGAVLLLHVTFCRECILKIYFRTKLPLRMITKRLHHIHNLYVYNP